MEPSGVSARLGEGHISHFMAFPPHTGVASPAVPCSSYQAAWLFAEPLPDPGTALMEQTSRLGSVPLSLIPGKHPHLPKKPQTFHPVPLHCTGHSQPHPAWSCRLEPCTRATSSLRLLSQVSPAQSRALSCFIPPPSMGVPAPCALWKCSAEQIVGPVG